MQPMEFPLLALPIGAGKRARPDDQEFYEYAAVVMYVKEFFFPITAFQRLTSEDFPVFVPEDTYTHTTIMQLENGASVWEVVRPGIQVQIDESYTPQRVRPQVSDAAYYVACWLTLPNVDAQLAQLLSDFSIRLPTDPGEKTQAIDSILSRANVGMEESAPLYGTGSLQWFGNDFVLALNKPEFEPFVKSALERASKLLDGAFQSLGKPLTAETTVYRGVTKPKMPGLWYDENEEPIVDTCVASMSASLLSTSTKRAVAADFCKTFDRPCILYKIHLPAGVRVLRPPQIVKRQHGGHPGEEEIILPQGCKFEVLRQYKVQEASRAEHVIELRLVA